MQEMQELIASSQALCTISLEFDSPIATLDFGGAPPSSCGHMSHGERGVKTVRPRAPPPSWAQRWRHTRLRAKVPGTSLSLPETLGLRGSKTKVENGFFRSLLKTDVCVSFHSGLCLQHGVFLTGGRYWPDFICCWHRAERGVRVCVLVHRGQDVPAVHDPRGAGDSRRILGGDTVAPRLCVVIKLTANNDP